MVQYAVDYAAHLNPYVLQLRRRSVTWLYAVAPGETGFQGAVRKTMTDIPKVDFTISGNQFSS